MLVGCVGVLLGDDLRPSSPRVGSLVIVVVAVVFGILLHYTESTFLAAADTVACRLLPCHHNLHTFVVVLVSMHLCNYNV